MRCRPPLEKHIVANIMRALRARSGVVVRKRHGTAMGVAGDPDLYGSIDGKHFEIEVKRPDGPSQLTILQAERLREWARTGALTGIATSVEDALRIIDVEADRGHHL